MIRPAIKRCVFYSMFLFVCVGVLFAEDAKEILEQANKKWNTGDWDGALALYDKAIHLSPLNSFAYTMRGNCYYAKKDYENASSNYSNAVVLAPQNSTYHENLAKVLEKLNRNEEAKKEYDNSIRLDPSNIESHLDRGILFYNQTDYKSAIGDFSEAASIKPPYQSYYTIENRDVGETTYICKWLGDSKLKLKDFKGAVDAYTRAIQESPHLPQIYEGRADAWDGLGDTNSASVDRAMAKQLREDPDKIRDVFKNPLK
jgi:tetratricopeptide (TPR) repeat protein